jgi:serine/threonine-protein kinase
MKRDRLARLERVVHEALESPAEERAERLAALCAGDEALLREAESLMMHAPASKEFLETPCLARLAGDNFDADMSGERVGVYRLERRIGVGGMGAVYLGVREGDQRRFAIKLIRPGLASPEVLRRFRDERRTLAQLDHPNIARLLDGGTDGAGRPFLVMEFVDGQALPAFCDARGLDVRARLEVFLKVCDALAYAHRNLVVHRDLKPANILVADGGEPKLVDFGIASVLEGEGGVAATRTGLRPLTPEYASPEQVRGEPITTASDVYSLGVVLYELLAGVRPYEIGTGTWAEAERTVCQTEPTAPSVAAGRGSDKGANQLAERLRGDLDTVVMKALRKEASARYASVDELAEDIRRYLERRPVLAHRPSRVYRARRFVSRHQAPVAVASAGVLLGAVFIVVIVQQSSARAAQRDRAIGALRRARVVSEFWEGLLDAVRPGEAGHDVLVRELLDEAAGRTPTGLGEAPRDRASLEGVIGRAYLALGELEPAEGHLRRALEQWTGEAGSRSPEAIDAANDVAEVLYEQGRSAEAEELLSPYLDAALALEPDPDGLGALTLNNLGALASARGDLDAAEAHYERALDLRRAAGDALGEAETLNNFARLRSMRGEFAPAVALLERSLEIRETELGPSHPLVVQSLHNLAVTAQRAGDVARAESLLARSVELAREVLPEGHVDLATPLLAYAALLIGTGRSAQGEPLVREALAILRRVFGPGDIRTANAATLLGQALVRQARVEEALALVDELAGAIPESEREGDAYGAVAAWRAALAAQLSEVGGRNDAPPDPGRR